MLLLVGLGNPGPSYKNHRHNAGFMALERVHDRASGSEWREKYVGLAARGVLVGQPVVLVKPSTFMNLSGRSVQRAMADLQAKPAQLIVVHDELELPFGQVRVKVGGGHGGHNGLRDISAAIGPDYTRVRVGIGRPSVGTVESYVLSGFSGDELAGLSAVLDAAADAVELCLSKGAEAAMNKHNVREKKK